jgi:hypothetical protein
MSKSRAHDPVPDTTHFDTANESVTPQSEVEFQSDELAEVFSDVFDAQLDDDMIYAGPVSPSSLSQTGHVPTIPEHEHQSSSTTITKPVSPDIEVSADCNLSASRPASGVYNGTTCYCIADTP